MNKHGIIIALAVAVALSLSGCSHNDQAMPSGYDSSQSSYSSKFGKGERRDRRARKGSVSMQEDNNSENY
ncbi:MAG: hypothetical protein A3F41_06010 [Coxiella sp. RIFCSPHIGHO2_12_FULL_44_14]|nr:MAG: hypothetical protein A3F41_06010 [Coxiella sp. RIFCSPHIGHO2_12_FULL_44_14]